MENKDNANLPAIVEIVVVEDDSNDIELISRVLKKHHFANNIVFLKDGAEALDYLIPKEGDPVPYPRVILLDIKLPKLNGIEILRQLKSDERTKKTPVVMLTSSQEVRDMKDAYELGANSYVTKPINFDQFAKAISDLDMYWLLLNEAPHDRV